MTRREKSLLGTERWDDDGVLRINTKFAKAFEEKSSREECTRLEEKYKQTRDDDSSSDDESEDTVEDEDGELITPSIDAQILKTLGSIRAKNPAVYDSSVKFFDESLLGEAEREWQEKVAAAKQQPKPVTVADYQREQLLRGEHLGDDEEKPVMTYEREQEDIKRSLLQASIDTAVPLDDFLQVKSKTGEEVQREDEAYKTFLLESLSRDQSAATAMNEWLAYRNGSIAETAGERKDDEAFLIDYVLNRRWIDKSDRKAPPSWWKDNGEEEDEQLDEAADDFEERHNFRFEQPDADVIPTFPRRIPESMRSGENEARKRARESRKQRKEAEAAQRDEELKRLKNLQKQAIRERLAKLKRVAGFVDRDGEVGGRKSGDRKREKALKKILRDDDGSDFDAAEFDAKMASVFDDDYYGQSDAELGDEEEPVEDASAANSRVVERAAEKLRVAVEQKNSLKDALADLKLEYEDKIGDFACRFKYAQVQPETFGLALDEILEADDAELNAYVSVKKLAPYLPEDRHAANVKRFASKRRLYKFRADRRLKQKVVGKSPTKARPAAPKAAVSPKRSPAKKSPKKAIASPGKKAASPAKRTVRAKATTKAPVARKSPAKKASPKKRASPKKKASPKRKVAAKKPAAAKVAEKAVEAVEAVVTAAPVKKASPKRKVAAKKASPKRKASPKKNASPKKASPKRKASPKKASPKRKVAAKKASPKRKASPKKSAK